MDSRRVARLLGGLLQPAIPGFFVALFASQGFEGGLTPRLFGVAAIITSFSVGVPLLGLWWAHRQGWTGGDLWGDRRESRVYFYPAAALGLGLSAAGFTWLYPFPLARAMVLVAAVVLAIMAVLNRWWKVSVHSAGNAGIAAAATWMYGEKAALLFLLVPLTAWARVKSGHHSIFETALGALIGAGVTGLLLWMWPPF
ncbi:MAG: hypothetical protein IPG45_31420 [Deltaproteobacteria bacterium]|nr:hypothetical protein [Deltaproteobacteria bacterium]